MTRCTTVRRCTIYFFLTLKWNHWESGNVSLLERASERKKMSMGMLSMRESPRLFLLAPQIFTQWHSFTLADQEISSRCLFMRHQAHRFTFLKMVYFKAL